MALVGFLFLFLALGDEEWLLPSTLQSQVTPLVQSIITCSEGRTCQQDKQVKINKIINFSLMLECFLTYPQPMCRK